MNAYQKTILATFPTVTLVPVSCRGLKYELRCYLPKRIRIDEVREWLTRARVIYDVDQDPTLEANRAGLCFCAFADATDTLIAAVNEVRAEKNLQPVRVP